MSDISAKSSEYFSEIISDLEGFAIFLMSPDGTIQTWNKGCELMKGYNAEEVIEKHYEILFPDFLRKDHMPEIELQEAFETGRYETENWRRRKGGKLFWAHVVLTKVEDESGKFIGYIKITQDYSDRKALQNELENKTKRLEESNIELEKAKEKINLDLDGFVYTASHDLRSPITNMEGLLSTIVSKSCYRDESTKPLIDMLLTSVEKLKKTIGELTEISKIQNAANDDIQEIKLNDLIEEVTFSLKDLIDKSNAHIKLELEDCPVIRFSTKNLRSIIYNLISNSIKYRSPERTPEVLIKTTIKDEYYVLTVQDNGLGLKKEQREKVFSMFKRFHDHVEGTGIGLYMVKRIVDNAGGKIELESELGKGTTFHVYLKQ